jgi:uncharacterized small protein (DUF1192 family)
MELKKLFETLAKRAGVDTESAEFTAALSQVGEASIDDTIAHSMEAELLNRDLAKSDFKLKTHFTALALNGVDSEIESVMNELLSDNDDARSELLGIKSTPKRAAALAKKIKELEAERNKADNKGDDGKAKKAQEEIDRLINDFKVKEEKYLSDLSAKEREKQEAISNFKEELFFSGLKFANDYDLETNQTIARIKINKALAEKGAKKIFNFNTGKFEIKRADDESLDYLDERNNKTSFEDFAKGVLTQEKILAVTDSRREQTPLQPFQQPTNGQTVDTSMYDALKIN